MEKKENGDELWWEGFSQQHGSCFQECSGLQYLIELQEVSDHTFVLFYPFFNDAGSMRVNGFSSLPENLKVREQIIFVEKKRRTGIVQNVFA